MTNTETSEYTTAFSDPALCHGLLERLKRTLAGRKLRFMEVCGTHTVSIFRSGLRALLPVEVEHLSGPGCPVCVTHDAEVAAFINLAEKENVRIATFGDLLRVPAPDGRTLKHAQAAGARIEVVYSPLDALTLAKNNPQDMVVFLGVGFETTAPTVAASIMTAKAQGLTNFSVLSFHKLVPPALKALVENTNTCIDAFLLPGHVSTVLGTTPYQFLADQGIPCVIAGFEPADILYALCLMAEQRASGNISVTNAYRRAVSDAGNPRAQAVLAQVFSTCDALWRGIGSIAQSGLTLHADYAAFNAMRRLDISLPDVPPLKGCRCGDVLMGIIPPPKCPLFAKKCTPASPVGPCMVSTEGSCAAYYTYRVDA